MSHIDDNLLLARLDDELAPGEVDRVREHLEECGECRRRSHALEERSRLFSRAVEAIDGAPRTTRWEKILERARETSGAGGGSPAERRGTPGRGASVLKAAVVLLAVTGVAAAIPGSPVDDWIGAAADRVAALVTGGDGAVEAPEPESPAEGRSTTEVSVALDGGRILVSLGGLPSGTSVEVSLAEGNEARVQAEGARYRTGPGRIEVLEASGERVAISLPRTSTSARVQVDGVPAVRLERGQLQLLLETGTEGASSVTFPIP
jgi:anti-sigma factor RsiW